jgi:hypothetical protein
MSKHALWDKIESVIITRSEDPASRDELFEASAFPDVIAISEVVLGAGNERKALGEHSPIWAEPSGLIRFDFDNGQATYRVIDYDDYLGQYLCVAEDE